MVSMAIKVIRVVGPENATTAQGLILGVGAFAALLANPIFGRLSDRTMSRFGRRRPWMVGGSLALAACLLLISLAVLHTRLSSSSGLRQGSARYALLAKSLRHILVRRVS